MREKWKRFTAGILAVLTIFSTIGTSGKITFAASPSAKVSLWNASVVPYGEIVELKEGYDHGKILYSMIDGHVGYCMNFGLSASNGQLMNSYENASTSLTDKQEKYLYYCLYYGFSSTSVAAPSNSQANEYIATQAMVWIIAKGIFGTEQGDLAAQKLCATAPDTAASYSYYTSLKDKIHTSFNATIPSFASSIQSGAPTYELKWNEGNQRFETTLSDSHGVLSGYDFSLGGYSVEKAGNNMTIYSHAVNTNATTGTLISNMGKVTVNDSCVFWLTGKPGDQEFVSEVPIADPLKAYMQVKTENIGYGELYKKDVESEVLLSGAVYGIYSDSGCTIKVQELTTDENGYAKSQALVAGTYYVKEITAPNKYVVSDEVHTLTVQAGRTTSVIATDKEQLGAITIYKEGEVLTGWDGSNFIYENKYLADATFQVTAGSDIYKADGSKIYNQGDIIQEAVTTGIDGQVLVTNLHLGTYVVTETATIDGYTINTTPQVVDILYKDQTVEVQYEATSIYNTRQKAEVSVVKKDADTENVLDGGEYTLYAGGDIMNHDGSVIVTKGTVLETVTTGEDGGATYTVDLPIGNSYYITETKAPYAYTRNEEARYAFNFNDLEDMTPSIAFSHTFKNDRTTAKIRVYKVDKELASSSETEQAVPQGDASLAGAVYGLYARTDIVHPDGATGVLFTAGDLIATITTDEKGEAEVNNLYLGNYYIKEIQASEGYLLDETEHDVICDYEHDLVAEVSRSAKSFEQVKKQPFQLIKVSDNGENTEEPLLEGAGFSAYLKSTLPVLEDGSYDIEGATKVVIGSNGETTLLTDGRGHLVTQPIPYGTYVVFETITPHNMETIKPFEVNIVEDNLTKPQTWRVFVDREFSAKLRVIKQDAMTGQTVLVPNATFQIFDLDRNEYVEQVITYPTKVVLTEFSTDEDGDLILPEKLPLGKYRIEEISAPNGYVINTTYVTVAVDTDTAYEIDPDTYDAIIDVVYENKPVLGELVIEKKGEILDDYKGGLFVSNEDKTFIYKKGTLAGAKFEVYAAEDILTNDYQLDAEGNRTTYYTEGELVATLVTGEDGTVKLSDIPMGSYKVVEIEAPYGYVLSKEEQVVTFTYVDDKTPIIYETITFENERQKIEMSIVKKDDETKEGILGATFGLYAKEDIINKTDKVIVKADTLLETAVSDEYGTILFTKDYPFGKYYVKEMKAPAGYVSSDEVIDFDTEYMGQEVSVAEYSSTFFNTPTTFTFTKEDITSGAELSGATLTILDEAGNVIETWTSVAGEEYIIKKLVVGESYILREEYAPYGYLKAEDIHFTVEDTGKIQSVVMKDEVPTGTIMLNKDGEFVTDPTLVKEGWYDVIFNYFKKSLAGVTFEVYAKEDIVSADGLEIIRYKADELVATIVTDENGFATLEELPLGKYYIVETKTLEGFVLDKTPKDADLTYVDQDTKVVYAGMNVTNERQKVEISVIKKDAETKEVLSGAIFGLYAKEDIVDLDGKVMLTADTEIERAVTGKDGKLTFVSDLPLGQYYVKEVEAPKGYVVTDKIFDMDASYQGEDIQVLKFEAEFSNLPTKVSFTKTDITGEHELEGAVLSIINKDGVVVETWTSTKEAHIIKRLPVGDYILREEIAPFGYTIATDIAFSVLETGELQQVVMKDEVAVGRIIIHKTDAETKKELAGAKFEIRDKAGNVIETLITDKNGKAESKELEIASFKDGKYETAINYDVVEVEAPKGYLLDETVKEVRFDYKDGSTKVIEYTLGVKNKPSGEKLPQTGDDYNPWIYGGLAAISLILGGVILLWKKKEEE